MPWRDQLLAAVALLREQRLPEGEAALQQILELQPAQADALHFMGVLRHQQGRVDEAVALIHQSLTHQPANATAWNNLGNVLLLADRLSDADDAYRRAVQFADSSGEAVLALNNLSTLTGMRGGWSRASSPRATRWNATRSPATPGTTCR